jgi:hypothetical protein
VPEEVLKTANALLVALTVASQTFALVAMSAPPNSDGPQIKELSTREASAATCGNSIATQAPATTWQRMPPPQGDAAIAYFLEPGTWMGLTRIYATSQILKHRKRSFLPWMTPQIVALFPFSHSPEAPANRRPLFYVNHNDTAADISGTISPDVHLIRLIPGSKNRELETTSGSSVFDFSPRYPSRPDISLEITNLSDSIFTLRPREDLANGEYLIVFGPVAGNGWEFEINCLR